MMDKNVFLDENTLHTILFKHKYVFQGFRIVYLKYFQVIYISFLTINKDDILDYFYDFQFSCTTINKIYGITTKKKINEIELWPQKKFSKL